MAFSVLAHFSVNVLESCSQSEAIAQCVKIIAKYPQIHCVVHALGTDLEGKSVPRVIIL